MLNTNTFHNAANILSLLLAAATAALSSSGCTTVNNVLECSHSWLNPVYTGVAISVLQAAKLIVNFVRDGGFIGMTAVQPPVVQPPAPTP